MEKMERQIGDMMKNEITVRAIIPERIALIASNIVTFCMAVSTIILSPRFDFITVFLSLVFLFCFIKLVYSWLRKKNWAITISKEHVLIKNAWGKIKQFSRDDVSWKAVLTPYYQNFRIRLFSCQNGRMIASVPFDWVNAKELLNLRHDGKIGKEELNYIQFLQQMSEEKN